MQLQLQVVIYFKNNVFFLRATASQGPIKPRTNQHCTDLLVVAACHACHSPAAALGAAAACPLLQEGALVGVAALEGCCCHLLLLLLEEAPAGVAGSATLRREWHNRMNIME
jgi:hypothetical protein